ncbi:MAG TPA: hypothetical protein VLN49_12045 [Gemmatimonadaceae bacterium]|nr:hypothetical protein [Gemmatimonadaceae bacterium]
MTEQSGDPIVDRAIDELRRLPVVDDLAVRRIVTAAAARRDSADSEVPAAIGRRARTVRPWIAIGLATAAAAAGFMVRGAWSSGSAASDASSTVAAVAPSATPISAQGMLAAAGVAPDMAPIPQQFVLRSDAAHRVSVVGDFNGWNPANAPMTRSPDGDLWSITIPVAPGRHTYGFMIDDTVFVLDPRAPKTRDPDLGADGSVRIVGRP